MRAASFHGWRISAGASSIRILAGAAAAWPLAASAQQSRKGMRIGCLGFGPASGWTSEVKAVRSGLLDLGSPVSVFTAVPI
jgi:hypothetical protein